MPVNRLTVDVSDGNTPIGVAWGELYELWSNIPIGTIITEIVATCSWQYAPVKNATTITTYTLAAAYPFNVALQLGPTGFSPVALTRSNYSNANIFELMNVPSTAPMQSQFPGSTDVFTFNANDWLYKWEGEYKITVASDLYLQTYAGHQASPQNQFQQDGTVNIWYD
jgi:hypothetical protein